MANQPMDEQFRMLRKGPWAVLDNHNATSYELVDTGSGNVNPIGFVEDGAISGTSVTDGSITAAKLATDAVTATKIQAGAVTNAKISDVDATKINNLEAGSNSFGTVTTGTSQTATITLTGTMSNATYYVMASVIADAASTNKLYAIVEARTTTTVDVRVVNDGTADATSVVVQVLTISGI